MILPAEVRQQNMRIRLDNMDLVCNASQEILLRAFGKSGYVKFPVDRIY